MSCCAACGQHGCACACGPHAGTPLPIYNRPGLSSLDVRVGTYGSFFATMQDALSDAELPALAGLRTRETNDPAMALIDAWSVTADVITFYQERIANEGYLRSATERFSVLELARLVDYHVRPGVAASVYLAYTVDKGSAPVTIPAGSKAQSVPAPGEQMQTFETSEPLLARYEWNALKPRLTRPSDITLDNIATLTGIYVTGMSTNLRANDRLLFLFGDLATGQQAIRRVRAIDVDSVAQRTRVALQPMDALSVAIVSAANHAIATMAASVYTGGVQAQALHFRDELAAFRSEALRGLTADWYTAHRREGPIEVSHFDPALRPLGEEFWAALAASQGDSPPSPPPPARDFGGFVDALAALPTLQPANNLRLARSIGASLARASDARAQLLVNFRSRLAGNFYTAWTHVPVAGPPAPLTGVYALRVAASLFGYNAPRVMGLGLNTDDATKTSVPYISRPDGDQAIDELADRVYLDNAYDGVQSGSYLVIQASPDDAPVIAQADRVQIHPRTAYGISGKTTDITLVSGADGSVWDISGNATIQTNLRTTQVYAQSERLDLADTPITTDIGRSVDDPQAATSITLDTAVDGLKAGSWLIVEGTRTDVPGTDAVTAAELVMLSGVAQGTDPAFSTDTIHSTLTFANDGLAYRYRRDSVAIHANVAHATNGETRREVLGSGNGAQVLQAFALKQSPLTFVSASTPAGVASTLEVRVNGVRWHEIDNLAFAGNADRSYVSAIDDTATTTVTFGNGAHGARLPTGTENITATYRNGIGARGNVAAGQISLLATKPLGVKEVVNPLPSSGGADADSIDQARDNVPIAILALDRLVSIRDYADFSRTFAGVGKAAAAKVRDFVHVTIAGANDIPIETSSDLYRNLAAALSTFGDPSLPVRIDVRALRALTLSAKVGLAPDYAWELVEPDVRAALLDAFGFQRRRLAQNVYLSEIVACMQAVRGVAWVDVDTFGSVGETLLLAGFSGGGDGDAAGVRTNRAAAITGLHSRVDVGAGGFDSAGALQPAEIAYFLADVPDTLLLQEASA